MYVFTEEQATELLPIIDAAIAAYQNDEAAEGIFTVAYGAVFDAITQESPGPNPTLIPVDGVPNSVWAWVAGAQDVNQSGSGFPGFIRTYTFVQKELRTGETLTDDAIQAASNAVAFEFLDALRTSLNGNREMLTIHEIGEEDAGAAASEVFDGDYAAWAGTLLFPYLEDSSFFRDLLLTNTVFDNGTDQIANSQPGTYDLIASLQTSYIAATSNFGGLLGEYFSGGIPSTDVSTLTDETNTYFASSYGLASDTVFTPGDDLLFNMISAIFPAATYIVGQIGNDNLTLDIDDEIIIVNSGQGDDEVTFIPITRVEMDFHQALIDGGNGLDHISYQGAFLEPGRSIPLSLEVAFEQRTGDLYDFSLEVVSDISGHSLYGFEVVTLGDADDTLYIDNFLGEGLTIDAGGSLEQGDLLDVSGSDGGITVTLQGVNDDPDAITLGSDTLSISNFDNVIGTDHVDNITGSDTRNIIDGGADDDVIDGGSSHRKFKQHRFVQFARG